MLTGELDYELPSGLIAQEPSPERTESRLLVLDRPSGELTDSRFGEVGKFLRAGDCLVLNDTRVLPARFFARRASGARMEGLFLTERSGLWEVLLKRARRLKVGERIDIIDRQGRRFCEAEAVSRAGAGRWLLRLQAGGSAMEILEQIGLAPLPPYIKRADGRPGEQDRLRYQTVYAKAPGAVAAPTAGLHFTDDLMSRLAERKVRFVYLTLHVGEGTFKPITAERLAEHRIHSEWYRLDEQNAQIINESKRTGGRIIAVGTTSVRTLETLSGSGGVTAGAGWTSLFIQPGYEFRVVNGMLTNFHLPRTTLLALVAAFAGLDNIRRAYRHAIDNRYRFYSYGDAMLIL